MRTQAPSPRTTVKRRAHRAHYDRETVYDILDSAIIVAVAATIDGATELRPMIHVRIDNDIVLHGHRSNALLLALASGTEVTINATIIDGLVLARSVPDHSMQYRSATIYAVGTTVSDADEKRRCMDAVFSRLAGRERLNSLPPVSDAYLETTAVLKFPIVEYAAKVNDEWPHGSRSDPGIWSGVIPLRVRPGDPLPDDLTRAEQITLDPSLRSWQLEPGRQDR